MNVLVTICGRGGSKGVKNKNIKEIAGLPLIAYSIKMANLLREKYNAVVALSTDSSAIMEVAQQFGLDTDYRRPEELATDTSGKIAVIDDLRKHMEQQENVAFDYVIDLDITSPLRTMEDVESAFQKLIGNPEAFNIFSVSAPHRNPYFNMVEETENDFCKVVMSDVTFFSRQQAPKVFDINGSFYIYRRSFFETGQQSATTSKSMYYLVPHICFDVDTPLDFDLMSYLITENKLDFDLEVI